MVSGTRRARWYIFATFNLHLCTVLPSYLTIYGEHAQHVMVTAKSTHSGIGRRMDGTYKRGLFLDKQTCPVH